MDLRGMRGLACVLACAGCGRIAFDDRRDAASDTAADVAAGSGPFGTPVELTTLDMLGADDPALDGGDELEIVFTSSRTGGVGFCDTWTATRSDVNAPWSAPSSFGAPVDTVDCEAGGFLSQDALTLWLSRKPSGGVFDLLEAQRATRTSPWQAPVALTAVNSTSDDIAPSVTADELELVFHSARSGQTLLYVTTRATAADAWGGATPIGPLTTGASEHSPHISSDGLALWFISDQLGTADIWLATRSDRASAFGAATVVSELSSSEDEDDPWVSNDGHRIYFARYPATGNPTLWMATR